MASRYCLAYIVKYTHCFQSTLRAAEIESCDGVWLSQELVEMLQNRNNEKALRETQ